MVMVFAGGTLHGIIASHSDFTGSHERVAIGPGDVFEIIFSEELAVNLDAEAVSEFGDLYGMSSAGGSFGKQHAACKKRDQGREKLHSMAHGRNLRGVASSVNLKRPIQTYDQALATASSRAKTGKSCDMARAAR